MSDESEATGRLATAIKELADAINKQTASNSRVKLTIGTPGTGGEMEIKYDPNEPIKDFMLNTLGTAIEKNEETLKAKQELWNRYKPAEKVK